MKVSKYDRGTISKIINEGTTFDRIKGNLVFGDETIPLTIKEEQLRERWSAAFTLLVNYHSNEQAVPLLMSKYGISRAQAYRDVAQAKALYGDINQTNKEADRYILAEWAQKTFQLAAKQRPPDIDNMNRAIQNIIKLKGLDKEDPDTFTEDDFTEHNYYMVMNAGGENYKIDLKNVEKADPSIMSEICQMLNKDASDAEIIEILDEQES